MFKTKEKAMEYELTRTDIDIISFALKTRIDTLEGTLLVYDKTMKPEEKAFINAQIRETKRVQEKTTYIGQNPNLK